MKKVDKGRQSELVQLSEKLRTIGNELTAEIVAFNDEISRRWQEIESLVESYNESVQQVNEVRESVHSDMDSYYTDRSEKWQEGEAGQNYQSWMEAWADDLPEIAVEQPDEIEEPSLEASDLIDDLPGEP
jgi:DNA repair ATPase RecN